MKEINTIYGIVVQKRITPEQMAYIINAVIIPKIEYRGHLSVFNKHEADTIIVKLRRLIRHKMSCANTIPNIFLKNKNVYNVIDFYERQIENHVDNLLLRVNDDGILGITTEIRLRQLQFDEWLSDNPLEIWNYNNINTFKHNLLTQILCLINDLGITFKINLSMGKNYKIIPGKFPLIDIFKDEYRYVKNSLRKKEFLYLEQFLYLGSYAMKKWDEYNKLFKGKFLVSGIK